MFQTDYLHYIASSCLDFLYIDIKLDQHVSDGFILICFVLVITLLLAQNYGGTKHINYFVENISLMYHIYCKKLIIFRYFNYF